MILSIHPKLKETYRLKEDYLLFNQTATLENNSENLAHIIVLFQATTIEAYRKFSDTLIH